MLYVYSGQDGYLYSINEVLRWYFRLLQDGTIDLEDYPSFASYYDSLFDMGECNYEVKPFDDIAIEGYHIFARWFINGEVCDFFIFPNGSNRAVYSFGLTLDEVMEFKAKGDIS